MGRDGGRLLPHHRAPDLCVVLLRRRRRGRALRRRSAAFAAVQELAAYGRRRRTTVVVRSYLAAEGFVIWWSSRNLLLLTQLLTSVQQGTQETAVHGLVYKDDKHGTHRQKRRELPLLCSHCLHRPMCFFFHSGIGSNLPKHWTNLRVGPIISKMMSLRLPHRNCGGGDVRPRLQPALLDILVDHQWSCCWYLGIHDSDWFRLLLSDNDGASPGLLAKSKFSGHMYFDSWSRILVERVFGGLMVKDMKGFVGLRRNSGMMCPSGSLTSTAVGWLSRYARSGETGNIRRRSSRCPPWTASARNMRGPVPELSSSTRTSSSLTSTSTAMTTPSTRSLPALPSSICFYQNEEACCCHP